MRRPIAVINLVFLLTACSSAPDSDDVLSGHGYSPNYVAGYHAGCYSGKNAGGDNFSKRERDSAAYLNEDYRTGWDFAFLSCKEKEQKDLAAARLIGSVLAAGVGQSHGADGIDARAALAGVDTSAIQDAGW